jgi:filamentous hemagglutinin
MKSNGNPSMNIQIKISNQAYDAGYSGILYPGSRKSIGNNSAVVLFGGRYNSNEIKKIVDKQINQRQGN